SDPAVFPDEAVLRSIIGEKLEWWNNLMDHTIQNYPAITPVWRYYNDGKQWLFRLLHKKDTLFWCSLVEDTFRITFYLTDKFEPAIVQSQLPEEVKTEFLSSKHYGKLKGITIRIDQPGDLEVVKLLIPIKLMIK
ncbi:MAG TPA: DUF3788 family protein, partial [Prolixibacteraceae bacterium]|nr:DUF3788 family protein [Prolixibacteraceae bacterium]